MIKRQGKITHKKSAVSGKEPLPTDLEYGELALNYADGSIFIKNSSDEIVQISSDKVEWKGNWTSVTYPKNSMVREGAYLGIANTETTDHIAPQNSEPEYLLPIETADYITNNFSGLVVSGHTYTFNQDAIINRLLVNIPEVSEFTNYRFVVRDITDLSNIRTVIFTDTVVRENAWVALDFEPFTAREGEVYRFAIESLTSSGDVTFTSNWGYSGISENGTPDDGVWNTNNQASILRISKNDSELVDRSAELLGIIAGSIIRFTDAVDDTNFVDYRVVTDPSDLGTYVSYGVEVDSTSGNISNGADTILESTIPVTTSTLYLEDEDHYLENAYSGAVSVEGFLSLGGVPSADGGIIDGNVILAVSGSAFGVSMDLQPIESSPEWDILAVTGADAEDGLSGSDDVFSVFGRTGNVEAEPTDYDEFYTLIGHEHTKANITDFDDADYATAAQGLLADSALQDITGESIGDLSDVDITTTAPTNDQVLTWNGTTFVPVTLDVIPVDSVFGRTGEVVAEDGDYNGTQVVYDNASSALVSTRTQGAIDELAAVRLSYESLTDTYKAQPTADGQVQDIGQEMFTTITNTTGGVLLATDPRVISTVYSGTPEISDGILANATLINDSAVYGINTTEIADGVIGKITTYGLVRDIDTSEWAEGTTLYLDPLVPGAITSTRPIENVHVVGFVYNSDPVDGVIFVNTIRRVPEITGIVSVQIDRVFFTADEVITTDGTYFTTAVGETGAAEDTTIDVIGVGTGNSPVVGSQDLLGAVASTDRTVAPGAFSGSLEVTVDATQGTEQVSVELYLADGEGVALDGGTGLPNGTLGVPPIAIFSSSALNLASGVPTDVIVNGLLSSAIEVVAGNRLRYRILASKVSGGGGDKNFSITVGNSGSSFIAIPELVYMNDLYDVESSTAVNDDILVYEDGVWVNKPLTESSISDLDRTRWGEVYDGSVTDYAKNDIVRDGRWTMVANKDTSERPAPQPLGDDYFLYGTSPIFLEQSHNGVVQSGSTYTAFQGGWVEGISVYVTNLSTDTNIRVYIDNITDPDNPVRIREWIEPILQEDAWADLVITPFILIAGNTIRVTVDSLNSSTVTSITGGWTYGGNNNGVPPAQNWYRDKDDFVAIDKTDLDGTDRTAELMSVLVGSEIRAAQTSNLNVFRSFIVTGAPVDNGTYVEYEVDKIDSNGGIVEDGPSTITIEVPTPTGTRYAHDDGYWSRFTSPQFGLVEGFLKLDGVEQPDAATDAFGVDLKWQRSTSTLDWDVLAISDIDDNVIVDETQAGITIAQGELAETALQSVQDDIAPVLGGDLDVDGYDITSSTDITLVANNININNEYNLPSADGTADQVLSTDGAGNTQWVDVKSTSSGMGFIDGGSLGSSTNGYIDGGSLI